MYQWVSHMKSAYRFDADIDHVRTNYILVAAILWLALFQPANWYLVGAPHMQTKHNSQFMYNDTQMYHTNTESTQLQVYHNCNLSDNTAYASRVTSMQKGIIMW